MGREIIFWKLNPKKSKNLIDFLESIKNPLEIVKGEEFCWDISKVKYNDSPKYSEIYEKVKLDINSITLEELNLITAYFYLFDIERKPNVNYLESEENYHNNLRNVGIDYIDEIPSKSPAAEFALTFGNSEFYLKNGNSILHDYSSKYHSNGWYGDSFEIIKNIKFVDYCAKRMILELEESENDYQLELLNDLKTLSQDEDLAPIFTSSGELKIPFKDLHDFEENMHQVSWRTTSVMKQIKNYKGRVFFEDTW